MSLDRVRDRGNKKWSMSMMLTEHVVKLKDWYAEDNYIQQTLLDDWEQQLVQEEIEVAYKRQCVACVTIWRNGMHRPYSGKITELNQRLNYISVEGPFGEDKIPVSEIIKVECMD